MQPTVEQLCGEIERLQLMSSKDSTAMKSRWFRPERKDAADPNKFCQWLLANHYLTEFVVRMLGSGKANQLMLDQYRIRDQVRTGPLTGAYLATDPLDRLVLIQVLSSTVTHDPARMQRVQEVGRQLISLQHPNVCRCLALGEARGLHYLVREHYEGETLGGILQKREKLSPGQAARIFAHVFEGLKALHERQVPGGALTADCILLTGSAKGPKTVRILIASARKDVFSSTAIGGSMAVVSDELDLVPLDEAQPGTTGTTPAEDIFQLGCVFYRCLTGREPFSSVEMEKPTRPAQPVQRLAPEVPAMLAEIVEEMIDIDPTQRAQNVGHIGKSLRVFLKTEEEAKEAHVEEHVAMPEGTAVNTPEDLARERAAREAAQVVQEEEEEEEEPKPRPPRPRKPAAAPVEAGVETQTRMREIWAEFRPHPRDLVYIATGAVGIVFLLLLVHLVTSIDFVNLLCLVTGATISFFVERFVRWREHQTAAATPAE